MVSKSVTPGSKCSTVLPFGLNISPTNHPGYRSVGQTHKVKQLRATLFKHASRHLVHNCNYLTNAATTTAHLTERVRL